MKKFYLTTITLLTVTQSNIDAAEKVQEWLTTSYDAPTPIDTRSVAESQRSCGTTMLSQHQLYQSDKTAGRTNLVQEYRKLMAAYTDLLGTTSVTDDKLKALLENLRSILSSCEDEASVDEDQVTLLERIFQQLIDENRTLKDLIEQKCKEIIASQSTVAELSATNTELTEQARADKTANLQDKIAALEATQAKADEIIRLMDKISGLEVDVQVKATEITGYLGRISALKTAAETKAEETAKLTMHVAALTATIAELREAMTQLDTKMSQMAPRPTEHVGTEMSPARLADAAQAMIPQKPLTADVGTEFSPARLTAAASAVAEIAALRSENARLTAAAKQAEEAAAQAGANTTSIQDPLLGGGEYSALHEDKNQGCPNACSIQ
jgi:myosin heavy subunit